MPNRECHHCAAKGVTLLCSIVKGATSLCMKIPTQCKCSKTHQTVTIPQPCSIISFRNIAQHRSNLNWVIRCSELSWARLSKRRAPRHDTCSVLVSAALDFADVDVGGCAVKDNLVGRGGILRVVDLGESVDLDRGRLADGLAVLLESEGEADFVVGLALGGGSGGGGGDGGEEGSDDGEVLHLDGLEREVVGD